MKRLFVHGVIIFSARQAKLSVWLMWFTAVSLGVMNAAQILKQIAQLQLFVRYQRNPTVIIQLLICTLMTQIAWT